MEKTQERIKVYDQPFAEANYYPEEQTMFVEWKGNIKDEDYKDLFNTLLKEAETKKTKRFISNTLKQGMVSVNARKYFENEVTPRSVELGMKRTAVVTDANTFKRYYLNMVIKASSKFGNPVKLCKTEKEAWDFVLEE